jgi:hypothetical protein
LTVDEVAFLKTRIGLVYNGPLVYGRFLELVGDEIVKPEDDEVESKEKEEKK